MFFALCVTVLNDVDTLSPSADVRINLPKRQLFDFVFALTEFPKQKRKMPPMFVPSTQCQKCIATERTNHSSALGHIFGGCTLGYGVEL